MAWFAQHNPPSQSQLCGYENRLSEIKGRCGKAEGWRWWEMRWRRLLSLKFYSHLAPSTPNKFSVHTALRIAIETFLLITTETSFPTPDKESSLPVETARISHFQGPPPSAGCTYRQQHPSSPYKHIFHLFFSFCSTAPLFSNAPFANLLSFSCHAFVYTVGGLKLLHLVQLIPIKRFKSKCSHTQLCKQKHVSTGSVSPQSLCMPVSLSPLQKRWSALSRQATRTLSCSAKLLWTFGSLQAKFLHERRLLPVPSLVLLCEQTMLALTKCLVPFISTQCCYLENTPVLCLPLCPPFSLSLVCVFGTCARYFPSQSACTQNAPSPRRIAPPPPPASLLPSPPTLTTSLPPTSHPPMSVAKQPPAMSAGAFSSQSNDWTYFSKRCWGRKEDLTSLSSLSSFRGFALQVLFHPAAHARFGEVSLWSFSSQGCALSSPLGGSRISFLCYQEGCKNFLFFFLLLLLSNPHSHVFLPVKHLWFLQMSLTPFCLCFHHFEMHHIPWEKTKKNLVALKKKLKTIQIQSINLQKQSMITIQINSRQILVEGTNRVWDPGLG